MRRLAGTVLLSVLLVGGARSATRGSPLIAFTRAGGVYVMHADGSGTHLLCRFHDGAAGSPVWSPDGSRIALGGGGNGIWVMGANGGRLERLVREGGLPGISLGKPTWSPDSRQLAFTAAGRNNRDIWVMNADGGNQHRLVRTPHLWEEDVDWSPTGSRIAFTSHSGIDYNPDLFVINADGSNLRRLTMGHVGALHPDWWPDGNRIAFARFTNGDIYITNRFGRSGVRLTWNKFPNNSPAWSPDGRRIAFVHQTATQPSGAFADSREIYVMNTNGTRLTRLTHERGEESGPTWQPIATR